MYIYTYICIYISYVYIYDTSLRQERAGTHRSIQLDRGIALLTSRVRVSLAADAPHSARAPHAASKSTTMRATPWSTGCRPCEASATGEDASRISPFIFALVRLF